MWATDIVERILVELLIMRDQLLKWQNLKSMVLFTFFNDKESEADRRKDVFQERIVLEKATHTLF